MKRTSATVLHTIRLLLVVSLFCISCQKARYQPAWYYWNSVFELSPAESDALHRGEIKKLYVHFFDLRSDAGQAMPHPEAVVQFHGRTSDATEIIPVVYIDNRSLVGLDSANAAACGEHLANYSKTIAENAGIGVYELQLDCDWTAGTRAAYFALIRAVIKTVPAWRVSATIRLHQVKFPLSAGVPPVDRGMLMYYNMGGDSGSSILNDAEGAKYLDAVEKYALPLDVALPVYRWTVLFRNGRACGILHKTGKEELDRIPELKSSDATHYRVMSPVWYRGVYLMQDDLLKAEEVTYPLLYRSARRLSAALPVGNRTVAFFELDDAYLQKIPADQIARVGALFGSVGD